MKRHRLPAGFERTAREFYQPLCRWLGETVARRGSRTFVLGVNGAQGTGKSTLSQYLAESLGADRGWSVASLSIDDIYLTRDERAALAASVHPLLATRGVPGTHDVELGKSLIDALCSLGPGERMALPRFDKAVDDRLPAGDWDVVTGPVDLLVFEGWCVASEACADEDLLEPLNGLESREDPDRRWRRYVNSRLASVYPDLFARLDALVFLAAPGFEAIRRWRLEQERKLFAASGERGTRVMDEAAITRFVDHFERITRHDLKRLPARADVVLELGEDHAVEAARYRGATAPD